MSVLLVDAGNTRIKWAYLDGGRLSRSRAVALNDVRLNALGRRLFAPARRVKRVVAVSVAGPRVRRALTQAARSAQVPIRFIRTPSRAVGVTVGYTDPWRLGADRFVGLAGARSLFPRVPVCVAGIGTALTVDLLGATGRHFGGAIIPGPKLMVATLLSETHGIRRRAQGGGRRSAGPFGRSTRAAIEEGARYACAAAIDRAVEEGVALTRRRPLAVLTGGGAPEVVTLLKSPCVVVPDLVLKGLAVLAAR